MLITRITEVVARVELVVINLAVAHSAAEVPSNMGRTPRSGGVALF